MIPSIVCLLIALTWPPEIERALELAGDNRPELERVLEHYRQSGDQEKIAAAGFLVSNMEGHGYVEHAFFTEDDVEVEFNALEHGNYKKARAAMDALEAIHGPIHYGRKTFHEDLQTITADFLIENIDLAFEAWRERPWAGTITFEVFCEHILPYRGSNEPLERWRPACVDRLADLTAKLDDPTDLDAASKLVHRRSKKWVGFSTLYYLHPTDQGYAEMTEQRRGRCEDMSNMMGYAFRASAVVAAQDYTPYWANRDNNHAWEVRLDAEGHGRARLSNVAAKVYRKTFSMQRDSLGALKNENEKIPRWLSGRNYKDVTADYMETTDVTVEITPPVPGDARFAYLCVFNGGEWRAIHWGRIEGASVTFDRMGRGVAYLPACYVDEELVPVAQPFVLEKDGTVAVLNGSGAETTMSAVARVKKSPPVAWTVPVKPNARYELFVWDDGWESRGTGLVTETDAAVFEGVPAGRLYWLVAEGSRRLERIFTMPKGLRRGW